jgi:hypothetical protein
MDDFSPEFSEKIRNAYAQGHTPEQIISHFESTNHPEGMRWANQMKELQGGSDVIPMSTPSVNTAPSFRDTSTPLIDTYTRNAELLKAETKDMSLKDQAIAGAEIAAGLYAGKKAIDISSRMLHNLTPQGKLEIEKARAELEASKESSKNYAIQTQTAAKKLELEQQLAANAQPSSLDELKAQALMNEERRKQELHDIKMDQLKQKVIKGQTQVDKISQSADVSMEEKIAAENIKLQPNELTGHLFNKYGTTPTTKEDLVIFANQSPKELRGNFSEVLIDEMNKGLIPKPAADAGVTPTTSMPEAQTLVTTAEAAKDPAEKVKESIPPKELKTGSGMPAFQGTAPPGTPLRKEFSSAANIPSTHAFVPGGQYMDIVRNAVGQDAFTASLLKQGGYPQTPEEAYSLSRLINENMSRMPRDVAKDLNIGLGDTTKAITQKVGGGKAVKLAGTAGALVLMADLASAKTDKEKREAMRNLGEAILPPSMTSTEAGAPTLPANAFSESKKLGSPFRQQLMGVAPPAR